MKSWKHLNLKSQSQLKDKKEGDSFFTEYKTYADVPDELHSTIQTTMFSNSYDQEVIDELDKCLRVMPHHQNTSGFFITVIEKIAEMDGDEADVAEQDSEIEKFVGKNALI